MKVLNVFAFLGTMNPVQYMEHSSTVLFCTCNGTIHCKNVSVVPVAILIFVAWFICEFNDLTTFPIQYLTLYSVLDFVGLPGSWSFHRQAIIVKKSWFLLLWLLYDFLSLKSDVNLLSKSYTIKPRRKNIFVGVLKVTDHWYGFVRKCHGARTLVVDLDPSWSES